jgi:predicted ATPase/class 3 adenylate cyclase
MRCSKCATENPAGKKFCGGCGSTLSAKCPRCGAENTASFKFCGDCGASLSAQALPGAGASGSASSSIQVAAEGSEIPEGERKTVTALFADIKGSMDLMENRDPEEARAIVDPALKLMIDAAHRYGGYIVQSTGDGIFALFGAPVAHEHHPQRALYAALRMQDEVKRYAEKLRAEKGVNLQVRVGVNTGEVVVRSIRTDEDHTEYTPIGHSTSLAARLQALAAPGSIAVSETLRTLVEGYFAMEPLGPARIKGVSNPVDVFEVKGLGPLRTRLQRGAARGLTKFVGRERQMEALTQAADRARFGHGQIVALIAEAGTGKSRLFFEFEVKNQSGWEVLEAFSVSHGKASAYLSLLELLHGYFKIVSEDDARKRREKVSSKVLTLDKSLDDALPYLFGLLRIGEGEDPLPQFDANVRQRRMLEAVKRVLLRESLNQPLIVIFEDLQWIDEQTQEFINLFADSIANAKVLLLVSYRPEYSHQRKWKTYYTQLRLDPLGKDSADEMLSALLGDGAGLDELKRAIIGRTEGNPLFMEETVQVLLDEGTLVRNGEMHLTKQLGELKIPLTVQGILAARIDRLPADDKDLLQTLSVIGREFPISLILSIVPRQVEDLDRMLNNLQLGEFIYEQPALGETEYTFKHALTREVAYKSVLISTRTLLHESIGEAIERLYSRRLDHYYGELARHYSSSANSVKAIKYLRLAGEQAASRAAVNEATSKLSQALDFVSKLPGSPERDATELEVLLLLGPVLMAARGQAATQVERTYERAVELSLDAVGTPSHFAAAFGILTVRLVRGQHDVARKIGESLVEEARVLNSQIFEVNAHSALGVALHWLGEFASARQHFERACLRAERPEAYLTVVDTDARINSALYLAHDLWHLGYPDQALAVAEKALREAHDVTRDSTLAAALTFNARLRESQGEISAVAELADSLAQFCAHRELPFWAAQAMLSRGWVFSVEGAHSRAILKLHEAVESWRALGSAIAIPVFLGRAAEAYLKAGQPEKGIEQVNEAIDCANRNNERQFEAELMRLKGELLRASGGEKEAENCLRKAINIARRQQAKSWELRATTSLARLLRDTNRHDEARSTLADIYNWFTEGFGTADLKEAKALLDELNA